MPGTYLYILAGGRARRFNEEAKGLKTLGDNTLIEHIIATFKGLLSGIAINTSSPDYKQFALQNKLDLPIVEDKTPRYSGPLAGLHACMTHMTAHSDCDQLLLCPCDTPFIDAALYQTLCRAQPARGMACFRYDGFLQPAFSLWHKSLAEDIRRAVTEEGMAGFKPLITALGQRATVVNYPLVNQEHLNPFFNINTPAELARARELFNDEQRH